MGLNDGLVLHYTLAGDNQGLPVEYQRVEYLQCNGSQYIDTGYIPNQESVFEGIHMHTESSADTPLFGSRTSDYSNSYTYWTHPLEYSAAKTDVIFNGKSTQFNGQSVGTKLYFKHCKTSVSINNETKTITTSTGSPNLSIIFMGLRNGASIDNRKYYGKVFWFKISEGNVPKRNFVPCKRKSDSVLGMYDTVNGVFYTNSGSGAFTAGAEIVVDKERNIMNNTTNRTTDGTYGGTISYSNDSPRYGSCMKFESNALIPINMSSSVLDNGFTISGWFKYTSGVTYYGYGNSSASVVLEYNRYFVYCSNGTAYVSYWTNTPDTWQFITLVHNNNKLYLYVNGNYISYGETNSMTLASNNTLYLGGRYGENQYRGYMSDFRIYNRALSASEIMELYNGGKR